MDKKSTAKKIGKGLAYFQAFADDVMELGFKALKNVSKKKVKKDDSPAGKVKSTLSKAAGFLGEMGEEFYHSYEDLKAKKKK